MNEIIECIKKSAIEIKQLIELGDTDKSENENATGDTQLKLDIRSDIVLERNFQEVKSIKQIVSEEQEEIKTLNADGEYLIAYDPLDGSSLVDVNLSIGSIFGIYKNDFTGKDLIASVYVVYGPKIEMVIANNEGVKLYRLAKGEFKYKRDIKLDEKGIINATGSTQSCWSDTHRSLVDKMFEDGYYLRYSGGMVPDLHQILLKGGGLFSYPGTSDKPDGKLRQLFEVFPFAYAYEQAGGKAVDGKTRVLDIETSHIHDTSPCYFGSNDEIKRVLSIYNK